MKNVLVVHCHGQAVLIPLEGYILLSKMPYRGRSKLRSNTALPFSCRVSLGSLSRLLTAEALNRANLIRQECNKLISYQSATRTTWPCLFASRGMPRKAVSLSVQEQGTPTSQHPACLPAHRLSAMGGCTRPGSTAPLPPFCAALSPPPRFSEPAPNWCPSPECVCSVVYSWARRVKGPQHG